MNLEAYEVQPSGEVRPIRLTPEEWARRRKAFSATFDPVTLERLSIKRHREASERMLAQSQAPAKDSVTKIDPPDDLPPKGVT
jgi:hypothetical protein